MISKNIRNYCSLNAYDVSKPFEIIVKIHVDLNLSEYFHNGVRNVIWRNQFQRLFLIIIYEFKVLSTANQVSVRFAAFHCHMY